MPARSIHLFGCHFSYHYSYYSMAQAKGEAAQKADLEAPDVPKKQRTVTYGTVPDDWTLHAERLTPNA